MISPVVLLLVLVLLALAIRGLGRGRGFRSLGIDRNQPRHPVVRIVCGVLALGLVGAVSWFSWKATAPATTTGPTLLLPTQSATYKPFKGGDDEPQQFIYTLLAVTYDGGSVVPLAGESVVINWPQDRNREFVLSGRLPGGSMEAQVSVDSFRDNHSDGFWVSGTHRVSYRVGGSSGSMSGGSRTLGELGQTQVGWRQSYSRAPLSLVPVTVGGKGHLLFGIIAAGTADPVEVDAAEWLRQNAGAASEALPKYDSLHQFQPPPMPNGVEMLRYTGPASWLLLLAAILAAQVFRRRGMAFAGAVALMVLLAITLDRVMVERQAALLADETLEGHAKSQLIQRMSHSFFHAAGVEKILATPE